MSGPVRTEDVPPDGPTSGGATTTATAAPAVEVTPGREARVGGLRVVRALPRRGHRTVGAWCFADHMAPPDPSSGAPAGARVGIGPHPHIGLQTVTWLLAGEVVHRDSLGSEQPIRPGQLNLMTAGHGVAHAEESPAGSAGARATGVQLWVAQPEATRHGQAAFEHHPELPQVALGAAVATVLVGELAGAASPARRDTDHMGADLALTAGTAAVPLRPDHEHAVIALAGQVGVGDAEVTPGHLAYLAPGRPEVTLATASDARVLLLGGVPFPEPIVMWWNFVARSHDEVDTARREWQSGGPRFGAVDSGLDPIAAPPTPWGVRP